MSACREPHEDWKICTACLPAHGKLIRITQCMRCGLVPVKSEFPAMSPTRFDVTEIAERWPFCRKCQRRQDIPSQRQIVSGYVHRLFHRIQAAFGRRKCVACNCLTSNVWRPIQFSLGGSKRARPSAKHCF
jgi:hypothetical protein